MHAYVIGEHGDSELLAWSTASIGMIPLAQFPIPLETSLEHLQNEYSELTRRRGYEILERKGNTSYGVATVVAQLVNAILRDEKRIFTVSVRVDSHYGVGNDVVLGLPCIIGKQGIESQLLLPLNELEQQSGKTHLNFMLPRRGILENKMRFPWSNSCSKRQQQN